MNDIDMSERIQSGYVDHALDDTKAKNKVDATLTAINEYEIQEMFNEGLKQAADYAKRMGIVQEHPIWTDIATLCTHIRKQGMQMFNARAISRVETLKLCDDRQKMTNAVLENKRTPKKRFIMEG